MQVKIYPDNAAKIREFAKKDTRSLNGQVNYILRMVFGLPTKKRGANK